MILAEAIKELEASKHTKEFSPSGFACDIQEVAGGPFCENSADFCYEDPEYEDDHSYFCRSHDPFPKVEPVT